jgi:hypothetical protein
MKHHHPAARQRLLIKLPKHPTIAGYFWIAYFFVLLMLFLWA